MPIRTVEASSNAEVTEQLLRRYHAVGRRVLSEYPAGVNSDHGTHKRIAVEEGLSRQIICDARRFARAYSDSDLERICGLRTRRGTLLCWYRVRLLSRVEPKRRREKLENRAASEGWSIKQTQIEINKPMKAKPHGRSTSAGRPFAVPGSLERGVSQILEHAEVWIRRCDVWDKGETSLVARVWGAAAAPDAATQKGLIDAALARLRDVSKRTNKLAKRLARGWAEGAKLTL